VERLRHADGGVDPGAAIAAPNLADVRAMKVRELSQRFLREPAAQVLADHCGRRPLRPGTDGNHPIPMGPWSLVRSVPVSNASRPPPSQLSRLGMPLMGNWHFLQKHECRGASTADERASGWPKEAACFLLRT